MIRRPILRRLPVMRDLSASTEAQAAALDAIRADLDAIPASVTRFADLLAACAEQEARRAEAARLADAEARGYLRGRADADRELAAAWSALARVLDPAGPASAGAFTLPREDSAEGGQR